MAGRAVNRTTRASRRDVTPGSLTGRPAASSRKATRAHTWARPATSSCPPWRHSKPMRACCGDAPCLHRYATSYPAGADQIRQLRYDLGKLLEDCPAADEIVLCASELATNAVQHSCSRRPG